jgi:hypothetical protein
VLKLDAHSCTYRMRGEPARVCDEVALHLAFGDQLLGQLA